MSMNEFRSFPAGRRALVIGGAMALGARALSPGSARAQAMRAPVGPIEFTVGAGVGGTPDVIMRLIAQIMRDDRLVENPIVVQNRTGAGHANAYNFVLGRPGNENTLLTLASPVFTTPIVQGTPSVIDRITPIAGFIQSELVLLTTPSSPFNTLQDMVAAARARPGRVRVAGGASGGNDHIATGLIEEAAGVVLTYVPHESGGAARATFLGGNVELLFGTLAEGLEQIEAGRAKPLAILSAARRTEGRFATVPTAREQGVNVVYSQFWGVGGPPGLSPEVAAWWADRFRKATETERWQASLRAGMNTGRFYALAEAGEYFRREQQTFRTVLTRIGLATR
jgi:putative tricarboxylic transport membrane protein